MRKKIKNKYFGLAILLVLIAFSLVSFNRILGQSAGVITSVCKTNGGILMDKDNCPAGSEKWLIGGGNSGSIVPSSGDIAFIDGNTFLKKDGSVWNYSQEEISNGVYTGNWIFIEDFSRNIIPTGVDVNKIIQWNKNSLLTGDGIYWFYSENGPEIGWKQVNSL